jgi:hypothetical protein
VAERTKTAVLRIAADMLGGPGKLRVLLGVSSASLASWLAGNGEPPDRAFLKAVQVILDNLDSRDRG